MAVGGPTSMGLGSPQPVKYTYRAPSLGKPALAYDPEAHRVQTTVAQGKGDTKLAASFQPRPPVRPPGIGGLGQGSIVDTRA